MDAECTREILVGRTTSAPQISEVGMYILRLASEQQLRYVTVLRRDLKSWRRHDVVFNETTVV